MHKISGKKNPETCARTYMNKKILSVFLEKKHLIILWEKHKWSNNIGLLNGGKIYAQ